MDLNSAMTEVVTTSVMAEFRSMDDSSVTMNHGDQCHFRIVLRSA